MHFIFAPVCTCKTSTFISPPTYTSQSGILILLALPVCAAGPDLKSSQHYPPLFGACVAELFDQQHDHVKKQVLDNEPLSCIVPTPIYIPCPFHSLVDFLSKEKLLIEKAMRHLECPKFVHQSSSTTDIYHIVISSIEISSGYISKTYVSPVNSLRRQLLSKKQPLKPLKEAWMHVDRSGTLVLDKEIIYNEKNFCVGSCIYETT